MNEEEEGCFNEAADKNEVIDETWSDTNFTQEIFDAPFRRLVCRFCGEKCFEIMKVPGHYETLGKCTACGMYYLVHCG